MKKQRIISCAKYSCALFKEIYSGNETLLYAYRSMKEIPKEGHIGDVYYNFHGRGCYFEYPDSQIDVDLGPGGRCDAFDLYRIESFLQFKKDGYNDLKNNRRIKELFLSLYEKKIIKKHPEEPDGTLYYLSSSL